MCYELLDLQSLDCEVVGPLLALLARKGELVWEMTRVDREFSAIDERIRTLLENDQANCLKNSSI